MIFVGFNKIFKFSKSLLEGFINKVFFCLKQTIPQFNFGYGSNFSFFSFSFLFASASIAW